MIVLDINSPEEVEIGGRIELIILEYMLVN